VFPRITCDDPRDAAGQLVTKELADDEPKKYEAVIGHDHIQTNEIDPGPALQRDALINGARCEIGPAPLKAGADGK